MSHKDRGLSVCPGTVLSVLSLLLYSAGFIRIEVHLNDHDGRLMAVEEALVQMKQGNEDSFMNKSNSVAKRQRSARSVSSPSLVNETSDIKQVLEEILTTSLKIRQQQKDNHCCAPGRPGPPGRPGTKGDEGDQGRPGTKGDEGDQGRPGTKGDKGDQGRRGRGGNMGQPGKSGKQGIMGPPGIQGEKGIKGDIGPPGLPGMKGEPGESISPPDVTISPSQLTVDESNTASLVCSASGNPAAEISWTKINGSLPSNRTKVTSDGLMEIKHVVLEDAGKYKCMARNILGKDEKVAELIVQGPPRISLLAGPFHVLEDKSITLPTCHVTSFPASTITWTKLFGRLPDNSFVTKNGTLSISAAHKTDSGMYQCRASNKIGTASAGTYLVVVELPRFTVKPPPRLVVNETNVNVSVRCDATGKSRMKISWMKEHGRLPMDRSEVYSDGTLKITNVQQEDSGNYTCTASSMGLFSTSYTIKLMIKGVCNAVGVADRNKIPDDKMTASTLHASSYHPYFGRLHETRGSGEWCPKTKSDRTDFLQVDMGSVHTLCAVATQGRTSTARTTRYKLHLSTDGITWNAYKEQKAEKVFLGNTRSNVKVVKHSLHSRTKARYVRFYPITYGSFPCLRVEIFVWD